MGKRHAFAALLISSILSVLSTAPAGATGTVRIQQYDGTVRNYDGAVIRVKHNTIRVWSHDGKGTLVIDRAACSYVGELERCLPTTFQLKQSGQTKTIQLVNGLVYFNPTDSAQQLSNSSQQLPPHSLMLMLHTLRGTYISVHGNIDELQP
jgi:hypothetical protein